MPEKLGKHTLSAGCLRIKKLSDVNPPVLKTIVANSSAKMRADYFK